jgi:ABC-type antimicrobial peptide transport system permease subunit
MALGATARQVRGLVMRQALAVVGIGVVAGLGGALLLGRWIGALAFGVEPADPAILAATVLLLVTVAAIAAWLPARRAARVEPRIAMQDAP